MTYKERLESIIRIDAELIPAGLDAAEMKKRVVGCILNEHCPGIFFAGAMKYDKCRDDTSCLGCWNTEEPETSLPKETKC